MSKLFTMGEALIDFVALQKNINLKEVTSFEKIPGGAPANVAVIVAKYGEQASMITQLGKDAFGDYLIDVLAHHGVNTDYILQTKEAKTGLAFVSVQSDGERDFSFYRNPSADLLLSPDLIKKDWFGIGDYFHFCSVDLVESPMKQAHKQAIQFIKEKNGIISFDPNVRLSLWENPSDCRDAIHEFLHFANVVKVSSDELSFITGEENEELALKSLFVGDIEVIVYTKGRNGSTILIKNGSFDHSGYSVEVVDTTGAGDSFIGSFIYMIMNQNVGKDQLVSFIHENHKQILDFANASGALTASKRGAINAFPTLEQVNDFIKNN